jgi:hypothetical protein
MMNDPDKIFKEPKGVTGQAREIRLKKHSNQY